MKDSNMHLISCSVKKPTQHIASSTWRDPLQTLKYTEQENKVIFYPPLAIFIANVSLLMKNMESFQESH